MKPQFFKTPQGDDMVIIPRADYEALLQYAAKVSEDAAYVAIHDERKARLSVGEADKLPLEVTAAMVKGDSLLKALRDWRDMTQTQVAVAAAIGQGYYSELEKGSRRGSDNVLAAIAEALNVPEKWLNGAR